MRVEECAIEKRFERSVSHIAGRLLHSVLVIASGVTLYTTSATVAQAVLGDTAYRVQVFHDDVKSREGGDFSFTEWRVLRANSVGISDLAAAAAVPLRVTIAGTDQLIPAQFVSAAYFHARGAHFVHGSGFTCSEDGPSRPCLQAILNQQWQNGIVRQNPLVSILVNGQRLSVRGSVAGGAPELNSGSEAPRIWVPLSASTLLLGRNWITAPSNHSLMIFGRLPPLNYVEAERKIDETLSHIGDGARHEPLRVSVLPVAEAALTQTLRLSGFGSEVVVRYMPPLMLLLMVIMASIGSVFALRVIGPPSEQNQFRYFSCAFSCVVAIASVGAALGTLAAVPIMSLASQMAKMHRLPFEAPAISFITIATAAPVCIGIAALLAAVSNVIVARRQLYRPSPKQLYVGLSFVILTLVAIELRNGIFLGDFWDHSAAIRELTAHLSSPSHPIFNLTLPHQFFSPYSFVLALFSRFSGLSTIDSLRIAAVLNVFCLLAAFYLFTTRMFENDRAPLFGMVFLLLLWGPRAWIHSGFLHFNSIVQTAAFPSTFVSALTFLIWFLALQLKNRPILLSFVLSPLMVVALISHPLTSVAMFAGLAAIAVGRDYPGRGRIAIAISAIFTVAGAGAWPLFPFYGLLKQSSRWDLDASWMYSDCPGFLLRTFPALIAVPLVIHRLQRNVRDFVGLTFCLLLLAYLFGALTGKYVIGRVLPFMIVMLQLGLADWLSNASADIRPITLMMRRSITILVLIGGFSALPGLALCLPIWQNSYGDFEFLLSYANPSDTVLSDEQSSLKEPTFGGRVVAFTRGHTVGFVPDLAARNSDRSEFFKPSTSDAERRRIIGQYNVRFVVINQKEIDDWPSVLQAVEHIGTIQYWDSNMILVSVNGWPEMAARPTGDNGK